MDLYKGGLESVSGRVKVIPGIQPTHRRIGVPQMLKIGEMIFETQALLRDVFVKGDFYRVYFVSQSMLILAVEYLGPIPPGQAKRGQ